MPLSLTKWVSLWRCRHSEPCTLACFLDSNALSIRIFLRWPFYRPVDSLAPSVSYTGTVPRSLFSLDPSPQLSNAHTSLDPIGVISPGGEPENCPQLLQAGVPGSRSQHLCGHGCLSAHCLRESCGEKSLRYKSGLKFLFGSVKPSSGDTSLNLSKSKECLWTWTRKHRVTSD